MEKNWEHGVGVKKMTLDNQTCTYIGEFFQGKEEGYGMRIFEDGWMGEGLFKSGVFRLGLVNMNEGDRYFGSWDESGEKSGDGRYYSKNGAVFEGVWKQDKMNGKGTYYQADGSKTEGLWQENQKTGKFTIMNKYGQKAESVWQNGKKIS